MRPCLSVCVMLFLAAVASAQNLALPIVQDVVITNVGPGRIDESFVLVRTSVKTNTPLDARQMARDVRSLLDSGRFADAKAYYETVDNGVRILYALENKYRLAVFPKIEGAEELSKQKLMKLLELGKGDVLDDQVMGNAARRIIKEYQEEFYPDAKVTWSIDVVDPEYGTAAVTVYVDEGSKAQVKKVNFSGNENIEDDELKALVSPRRFIKPWTWWRKLPIDQSLFEELRWVIRDRYLDEGYLNAIIEGPDINCNEMGQVVLHFRIREGQQYRIGNVTVGGSGVDIFPDSDLISPLRLRKGDVASMESIGNDAQLLRDFFGARGYIKTRIRHVLTPHPETGVVDIHYDVTGGELVTLQNIKIRGNTRTRDKVIRRELLVYPGDVFNEVKVRHSERVVRNLEYFASVRSEAIDTRVPDEKDLIFTVEEKPTGQFVFGARYSRVNKIEGFFELTQRNFDLGGWPNFTGGGQKLKLSAGLGSRREQFDLKFVEPWFLDRKLSLGVDLFMTRRDYTDYNEDKVGAAVSLGKALPGPNRVTLRYKILCFDITDVADTNAHVIVDTGETFFYVEEENSVKSSLSLQFTHDTRSHPYIPTRGNRVTMRGELAGSILGGDRDIYELELGTGQYMSPWLDHVISFRTLWDVVGYYGDTDELSLTDRLFIGGGRTLRGYEWRDVGPKAVRADGSSLGHRPVGGSTRAMAKAEYTIPLISSVRVSGFFDIGNVWLDPFDFDSGNTASSAGVLLRLSIFPGFPLVFGRAWVVETDSPLTETEEWLFWFGL